MIPGPVGPLHPKSQIGIFLTGIDTVELERIRGGARHRLTHVIVFWGGFSATAPIPFWKTLSKKERPSLEV
jgi:hypothetical protein